MGGRRATLVSPGTEPGRRTRRASHAGLSSWIDRPPEAWTPRATLVSPRTGPGRRIRCASRVGRGPWRSKNSKITEGVRPPSLGPGTPERPSYLPDGASFREKRLGFFSGMPEGESSLGLLGRGGLPGGRGSALHTLDPLREHREIVARAPTLPESQSSMPRATHFRSAQGAPSLGYLYNRDGGSLPRLWEGISQEGGGHGPLILLGSDTLSFFRSGLVPPGVLPQPRRPPTVPAGRAAGVRRTPWLSLSDSAVLWTRPGTATKTV